MPFKPLSNALLNPHKAPFGTHLFNYLITRDLRRLLNNSFLTHFPTFSLHFCQYILRSGCWVVGVEWWVLMVSIKFIVNPHIIITQHSIPHIINTQHSSPNTQHSIPHIINTQHSSPITQHSTPITHHPSPITHHPIPHIINTQHSTPITQHPSPNIQPHTSSSPNIQHPSLNISPLFNFIISFFLCKFAVK